MSETFVEDWTEPVVQQLLVKELPFDMTVLDSPTVDLLLYPRGSSVPLTLDPGQAGIEDLATGKVFFIPKTGNLTALQSPYKIRWRITYGATGEDPKITFFPRDAPDIWVVQKP